MDTSTFTGPDELYQKLSASGTAALPDIDTFRKRMADPERRKEIYGKLSESEQVVLPDYKTFEQKYGTDYRTEVAKEISDADQTVKKQLDGLQNNEPDKNLAQEANRKADKEDLSWWESLTESPGEFAKGLGRGTIGMVQSVLELEAAANGEGGTLLGNPLGKHAVPHIPRGEDWELDPASLSDKLEEVRQGETLRQDSDYEDFEFSDVWNQPEKVPGWLSGVFGESTPQMLAAMGAAAATGGGATPAMLAAYGVNAPLMAGTQLKEARRYRQEQGQPVTEGDKAFAIGSGMLAAGVESVADVKMLKNVFGKTFQSIERSGLDEAGKEGVKKEIANGLTDIIKRNAKGVAKQMPTESATEAIQTVVENAGAKYGWKPEQEIMEGVPESAFAGAMFPVQFGAVSTGADIAANYRPNSEGQDSGPKFINVDQESEQNNPEQADQTTKPEGDSALESKSESGAQNRGDDQAVPANNEVVAETEQEVSAEQGESDIRLEDVIDEQGVVRDADKLEALERQRQEQRSEQTPEAEKASSEQSFDTTVTADNEVAAETEQEVSAEQGESDIRLEDVIDEQGVVRDADKLEALERQRQEQRSEQTPEADKASSEQSFDTTVTADNEVTQRARKRTLEQRLPDQAFDERGNVTNQELLDRYTELERNLREFDSQSGDQTTDVQSDTPFFAELDENDQIRVYDSRSGREVGKRSPNYAPAVAEFVVGNKTYFEQGSAIPESEASYLEDVARESENPLQIANAYLEAKQDNEATQNLSDPKQAIADYLKNHRVNTQDFKDFGNPNYLNKTGIAMQYLSKDAERDMDLLPRKIKEAYGAEVTVDEIIDFMVDNPGGPQSYLNSLESDMPQQLSQRFKEVTGAELDNDIATAITGTNRTANEDVAQPDSENNFDDEVPFRREAEPEQTAETTSPIRQALERVINSWTSRNSVVLVDSVDQLPQPARFAISQAENSGNIRGVFFDGRAYVILDRHVSADAALKTLLHEMIGHYGFRGLVQQSTDNRQETIREMNRLLDEVYNSFKGDSLFLDLAERYGYDLSTEQGARNATEEFIAKHAEHILDVQPTVWERVVTFLRNTLRKIGVNLSMNQQDIVNLLLNARQLVETGFITLDGEAFQARRFSRTTNREIIQEYFDQNRTIHDLLRNEPDLPLKETGEIWNELFTQAAEAAADIEGDVQGRPELANPTSNKRVRGVVDKMREQERLSDRPVPRSDETVFEAAERALARDYEGERDRLLQSAEQGRAMSWNDVDMRMARMIMEREGLETISANDRDQKVRLFKIVQQYDRVGTEMAAAFRQRQDDIMSPAERMGETVKDMVDETQKAVDGHENLDEVTDEGSRVQQEVLGDLKDDPGWKRRLAKLEQQIKEGKAREEELRDIISFLEQNNQDFEQKSDGNQDAIDELTTKLEAEQQARKEAEEQKRAAEQRQKELTNEIENLQDQTTEADLESYAAPLRKRIDELTNERDALSEEVERLKEEVKRFKRKARMLEKQLERLKQNGELGLADIIQKQKNQINRLKSELKKLREEGIIDPNKKDKKEETDEERALRLLTKRIVKETESVEQVSESKTDPVMRMVNALHGIVKEQLANNDPEGKVETPSKVEVIQDAFKHKEEYRALWEQSKEKVLEKIGDNADAKALLDTYFGSMPWLTFSEANVEGAVRTEMRRMDIDLNELVTEHYTTVAELRSELIDRFVLDSGLSLRDAELLANEIGNRFDKILRNKKLSFLKQRFKDRPKKEQKRLEERILDAIKAGALDGTDFRQAMAAYIGLPELSSAQVKELKELTNKAETAESVEQRNRALSELMEYITTQQIVGGNITHTLRTRIKEYVEQELTPDTREGDVLQTARQRRVGMLMQAIYRPPQSVRQELEGATPEDRDAITRRYLNEVDKVAEALTKKGINLYELTEEDLDNPVTMHTIIRAFQTAFSQGNTKMYEYWRNAILSGAGTHIINITGNTVNTAYEVMAKRWVESTINLVVQDSNLAQFGELKHFYNAWMGAIPQAWQNAMLAWKTEHSVFADEINKKDVAASFSEQMDRGASIKGPKGRIVRMPQRFLLFVDDLAKTMNYYAQVAALAFRSGKKKGLEGKELEIYISEQTVNPDEDISEQSWQFSLEMAFQNESRKNIKREKLGEKKAGIRNVFLNARRSAPWTQFLLPFITTPSNLLGRGLRLSPLGTFNMLTKASKHGFYKAGFAPGKKEWVYGKQEVISDLAEQVIGYGILFSLIPLATPSDDGEPPYITGSGAHWQDWNKYQFEQQNMPPYSIRLKGSDYWFSYKRLEPVSTMIATTIDAIVEVDKAMSNKQDISKSLSSYLDKMKNLITEKSYLTSVGDIMNILFQREPDAILKYAGNFGASWMPNIIRQTSRNTVNEIPNYRLFNTNEFGDFTLEVLKRTGQKALPIEEISPKPKVDWLGRELKKEYEPSPYSDFLYRSIVPLRKTDTSNQTEYDRMVLHWNNENPEEQWFPTIPNDRFTIDGEKVQLTEDEYYMYLKRRGAIMTEYLDSFRDRLSITNPTQRDIDRLDRWNRKAGTLARKEMINNGLSNLTE